jgi:hypothetical protein
MIVIKELKYVNLDNFSAMLGRMEIKELNIFSIHNNLDIQPYSHLSTNKGCKVDYMEVKLDFFTKFLNVEDKYFWDHNKHSLYIIRGGNYIDIKNIFTTINNHCYNLGRGGSQKSHMLSPLDFRLSCYMMAMSNFNFQSINNLNTFNYIGKDRYLSWMNKSKSLVFNSGLSRFNDREEFKPIFMDKMPLYCKDEYLGEYFLECTEINKCYATA